MRIVWLSAGLAAVLLLAVVGALLWRRLYRDDPANVARRIFKNSAVTFGLRMVVKGLDTIVLLLLVGSFDPVVLNAYNLAALLVAQYLATITEFGLGVLLTREAARDPHAARRLFGVTLTLRLLLVALCAVPAVLLVTAAYSLLGALGLTAPLSAENQAVNWILLLTLIPSAYSGAVTALYNAAERMEVPALIELITAVLSFLARIGVLALGLGVLGLAWAAAAVSSLTALIFFGLQRGAFFPPRLSWEPTAMRAIVPQATPLMLNNLLGAVFFRFDLFIVRAFGGERAELLAQQYTLPYQLLNIALVLPPAVTFAVFPLLARRAGGERAELAQAARRTLQILLIVAFPLAMGLCLLAPDLVWIFAREQFASYQPSIVVLGVLAWFLPLSFANGLLQYVLIAVDRQRAITRAFLLGAAFNLAANLVAVPLCAIVLNRPEWALYAAAAITILSEFVLYAVFRPLLAGEGLAPSLASLSWRPLLAALAMGGLMLALMLALRGPLGWGASVVAALLAPLAYGAALWGLGGVGAEERALILRIVRR